MALMFFIVYTYMQMAEISRASWEIEQEISKLQKEEEVLLRQKNSMIDRQEIERIAVEELGMVKPSEGQITYIDLSGEDHAEVLG
jgi:cell division protein FtsB